jgi:hypothetical protein
MSDENKKAIIDFALKELQSAMKDIKSGKTPAPSKGLLKLQQIITEAANKAKNNILKPEEEDKIAEDIVKDLGIDKKE